MIWHLTRRSNVKNTSRRTSRRPISVFVCIVEDLPAWIVPLIVEAVKTLHAMTAWMMMNRDAIAVWIHHILGWNRPK
eukprot:618262-Ditylum_brightwellii.AAC.1